MHCAIHYRGSPPPTSILLVTLRQRALAALRDLLRWTNAVYAAFSPAEEYVSIEVSAAPSVGAAVRGALIEITADREYSKGAGTAPSLIWLQGPLIETLGIDRVLGRSRANSVLAGRLAVSIGKWKNHEASLGLPQKGPFELETPEEHALRGRLKKIGLCPPSGEHALPLSPSSERRYGALVALEKRRAAELGVPSVGPPVLWGRGIIGFSPRLSETYS